jgi:hypothetical protein
MCILCSQVWVEEHWADAAADPGGTVVALETHTDRRGQRLRDRAERGRLFNLILAPYRLTLQDWEGSSYILRDAKGRSAVVSNLAQVWLEVERLTGKPLDPLDPDLLRRLRALTAGPSPS